MGNESKKPTILILGTFHMRPSPDMIQGTIDDILTSKRQKEIREVVDRIKQFKPTKLAVEVPKKNNKKVNEDYSSYVNGNLELEVNEVHQIGFRIAAECNHEKIYAIDWMEKGARKRGAGEVYDWAKENQPELFTSIFGWLEQHENESGENESGYEPTILDLYRNCNNTHEIKQHHKMYINMARIGDDDNYLGMDWLIWWYQRNLILFSNLSRLATTKDDRILLIIGSGHVQILYQLLQESGLFILEKAENYLEI